jgi:hypothetical protein
VKRLIGKYKLELIGGAAGSVIGWTYWFKVGCASGTCAITSSPLNSALYGALMGGVFLSLFSNKKNKQEQKKAK